MIKMRFKFSVYRLLIPFFLILSLYGLGRLYFYLTDGFTLAHISSDFSYNSEWEVKPLSLEERARLSSVLDQPYHYLGKGCQSYVFVSEDGRYVIKFFKYQRFRLQTWLAYFPPLPAIVKYRQEKIEKKWKKLDSFVKSWKVAFENLKEETGLIFVHLNKSQDLQKPLILYDKLGRFHKLEWDQMEFCVQHRAHMLCETLLQFKKEDNLQGAKTLISDLLSLILSEYQRGLADNDHALMQNTGVAQGKPIHIDVGQFVQNDSVKDPLIYRQELYTKMYKFRLWLKEQYPELATFLEEQLHQIIGPVYSSMQPKFRQK